MDLLQHLSFETFVVIFTLIGLLGAAWGLSGMGGAYRSIGGEGNSLDVPFRED